MLNLRNSLRNMVAAAFSEMHFVTLRFLHSCRKMLHFQFETVTRGNWVIENFECTKINFMAAQNFHCIYNAKAYVSIYSIRFISFLSFIKYIAHPVPAHFFRFYVILKVCLNLQHHRHKVCNSSLQNYFSSLFHKASATLHCRLSTAASVMLPLQRSLISTL